jgi:hypothetical protein
MHGLRTAAAAVPATSDLTPPRNVSRAAPVECLSGLVCNWRLPALPSATTMKEKQPHVPNLDRAMHPSRMNGSQTWLHVMVIRSDLELRQLFGIPSPAPEAC